MSSTSIKTILGGHDEAGEVSLDLNYNHLIVGCTWYSDSSYQTPGVPLTGLLHIEGRVNGNIGYSIIPSSPLDVTDNTVYADTSIPVSHIKVTPEGVTDGFHYIVTITGNDA